MKRDATMAERLRCQIRQLILLRETGPKSAAWHAARARLIWRLQEELKELEKDIYSEDTKARRASECS